MSSWKDWRAMGLGASDAPIVMGVSPWTTRYQLWEEKTGRVKRDLSNFATRRGHKLEPKARAIYEATHDLDMPAVLVENPRWNFIRASLDGYNAPTKTILEIKCPGKEDHQKALDGKIPEKYWAQLQHQLLAASGAERVHYFSYHEDLGTALVEVIRDEEYQRELIIQLCGFWDLVKKDIPPDLCDADFVAVNSPILADAIDRYLDLDAQIKALEKEREAIKASIMDHEKVSGRRVRVSNRFRINIVHRRGSVQYAKIPELAGVDVEKYRGPAIMYRTISPIEYQAEGGT